MIVRLLVEWGAKKAGRIPVDGILILPLTEDRFLHSKLSLSYNGG